MLRIQQGLRIYEVSLNLLNPSIFFGFAALEVPSLHFFTA